MKKTYIMLLIFVSTTVVMMAQKIPFRVERLITDYRGVVSNGTSILCYGDYGIITHTDNFGESWKQHSIGDKYSIKKIIAVGNDYIGVTEYSLIKSQNNGYSWLQKPLSETPKIVDMAQVGANFYVLTTDGVIVADAELRINSTILQLDTNTQYREIAADSSNLWIVFKDKYVLHYDIATRKTDTTDIIKLANYSNNTPYPIRISDIKFIEGAMYVTINTDYETTSVDNIVLSKDRGKSWAIISPNRGVSRGNCYTILDNVLHFLRPRPHGKNNLFAIEYMRVDSSHFAVDTSYFTVINKGDSAERELSYPLIRGEIYTYSQMLRITPDTLIGVGANKLISMSYNGGKTWKMQSYFRYESDIPDDIICLNPDTMFVFNYLSYYRTTDGGATWLPQKHTSDNPQLHSTISAPIVRYFNKKGKGFLVATTKSRADSNVLYTDDFGETYRNYGVDSVFNRSSFDGDVGYLFQDGVALEDVVLFVVGKISTPMKNPVVMRYSQNFHLIDSVKLNAERIISLSALPDGSIICLCLNGGTYSITDSAGNAPGYTYSYFLLHSTDQGKTWDSIGIQIRQPLLFNSFNNQYYYSNQVLPYTITEGNNLIFPTGGTINYRYDYSVNTFDSTVKPKINENKYRNTSFSFARKWYVDSDDDNLYSTNTILENKLIWDSVRVEDIFSNWDNATSSIISTCSFNDTSALMIIGRSATVGAFANYKANLVKLSPNLPPTAVEENLISELKTMLWNSYPYPMPGRNVIRCTTYWNSIFNINDATIKVYDVYGANVPSQNIKINKVLDYMGILEWNCSDVPSGVYIIQISLGGESHSFPVMVIK